MKVAHLFLREKGIETQEIAKNANGRTRMIMISVQYKRATDTKPSRFFVCEVNDMWEGGVLRKDKSKKMVVPYDYSAEDSYICAFRKYCERNSIEGLRFAYASVGSGTGLVYFIGITTELVAV